MPSVSGIYPHLAMFNGRNEYGTVAVVPWADCLWVITYPLHEPPGFWVHPRLSVGGQHRLAAPRTGFPIAERATVLPRPPRGTRDQQPPDSPVHCPADFCALTPRMAVRRFCHLLRTGPAGTGGPEPSATREDVSSR